MFIVDGTPGAGKTTLLGGLLANRDPDTVVCFPEAHPPTGIHPDDELDWLLSEDLARVEHARRLTTQQPDLVVTSDRCHIGVLAYRYALAATGRISHEQFARALTHAAFSHLAEAHHDDTIVVTILNPTESLRRRAHAATDPRHHLWFDPGFLAAYNEFLAQLDAWMPRGPRWVLRTDPPATHRPETHPPALPCAHGCADARSPLITGPGQATQLYTGALHHQPHGQTTASCLRTARDITATRKEHT